MAVIRGGMAQAPIRSGRHVQMAVAVLARSEVDTQITDQEKVANELTLQEIPA